MGTQEAALRSLVLHMRSVKAANDGPSKGERTPGIVFVLGAGCSMEYQLPSFKGLLEVVYEEFWGVPPIESMDFETLRGEVDELWSTLTCQDRRACIKSSFPTNGRGKWCPGYLRLARLMLDGFVSAVVNLNFANLLAKALDTAKSVSTSRRPPEGGKDWEPHASVSEWKTTATYRGRKREGVPVFSPHGCVEPPKARLEGHSLDRKFAPILKTERSGLFATASERDAAEDLLKNNHVVLIGYSGLDAKLPQVLWQIETSVTVRSSWRIRNRHRSSSAGCSRLANPRVL